METRANYILIGAFTLFAILGTLGFFIWLASVQIDRQYATYGILFDNVSGLDPSGDVLFNGISVGKVSGLQIYDEDPSKVFTTIQIDAATPVRSDTVAQLQSQGVTGVAYISLSGGTPGSGRLTTEDGSLPMITSERSTVQTLVEDAPDLLVQATDLLKQFQALTGPENQAYVTRILRNLDASSSRLDQALTDFSQISRTVGDATAQISLFTGKLDSIGAAVAITLENANAALASAQRTFESADTALMASGTAIDSVEKTFTEAQTILRDTLPQMLDQIAAVVARSDSAIADLQHRSGTTLDGFGETAALLNARLAELEQTLNGASTAFAAVSEASDSFGALVDGDGTLLVSEARDVLADAKTAIAKIEAVVIDEIASDITGVTGRFGPIADRAEEALASANTLLQRARVSLATLDTAMIRAQGTLGSAETAFDAATNVLQTDISPVLTDIRTASERISVAVESVTRDIPAISAELRALIARADAMVKQVHGAVAVSAPGIGTFAKTGLPELTRLSAEARNLVTTLNNLVRRIERDPARFLLDDRVPEYRK